MKTINLSLQTKIIATCMLIALLPLAIMGYITLDHIKQENGEALQKASANKLTSILNSRVNHLRDRLSVTENNIRSIAHDARTAAAVELFTHSYHNFLSDTASSTKQLQQPMVNYYNRQFSEEYSHRNGKTHPIDPSPLLEGLSPTAIALQHYFIEENPHPIGSKSQLVRAEIESDYTTTHEGYHTIFANIKKDLHFYDIMLIDNAGNVVYTVEKEIDFATSLEHGPHADSGLADAYRHAKTLKQGGVYTTPFQAYTPSYDTISGFIGSPLFANGKRVGVVVIQFNNEEIIAIMESERQWEKNGLGKTGETYLVAEDHTLRSESRDFLEDSALFFDELQGADPAVANHIRARKSVVGLQKINNKAVTAALENRSGVTITEDYLKHQSLASYTNFTFSGIHWAVIASEHLSEIHAPIEALSANITKYILTLALILAVVTFICIMIVSRRFTAVMRRIANDVNTIADGNFDEKVIVDRTDVLGSIQMGVENIQTKLLVRIIAERNEATRLKIALDQLPTRVMVTDQDLKIIYINDSMRDFLRIYESSYRAVLPNFEHDKVIGQCIDIFHKNPSHQRRRLSELTTTFTSKDVTMGEITIRLSVNPILTEDGKKMGYSVTWIDRTNEVKVEGEVSDIIAKSMNGDFSSRINMQGKEGFYKLLGDALNDISDIVEQALNDFSTIFKGLEDGDLTARITNSYKGSFHESKVAANNACEKINAMMSNVNKMAAQVLASAGEINTGNNTLSQRTQAQASALEETAASLQELTTTVKQSADHSNDAKDLSAVAQKQAQKGMEVVQRTIDGMKDISTSSNQISDIIGVIDEIAFQTNLLALNAAVEAARAGDAGRGFAVVATEVRTLAGRSAKAAKEIKDLIKSSVNSVEVGSDLVTESGKALEAIAKSSDEVNALIDEIYIASTQQACGIEQINKATAEMDDGVQQNAALVEETAVASGHLEDMAQDMMTEVEQFKLDHSEAVATRKPTPPPRSSTPPAAAQRITPPKAAVKSNDDDDDESWSEF